MKLRAARREAASARPRVSMTMAESRVSGTRPASIRAASRSSARPGPLRSRSHETWPNRAAASCAAANSKGVSAAKLTWPPSVARGCQRPADRIIAATPSPVPGPTTTRLPSIAPTGRPRPASSAALPGAAISSSVCNVGRAQASAAKSLSRWTRPGRRPSASASDCGSISQLPLVSAIWPCCRRPAAPSEMPSILSPAP